MARRRATVCCSDDRRGFAVDARRRVAAALGRSPGDQHRDGDARAVRRVPGLDPHPLVVLAGRRGVDRDRGAGRGRWRHPVARRLFALRLASPRPAARLCPGRSVSAARLGRVRARGRGRPPQRGCGCGLGGAAVEARTGRRSADRRARRRDPDPVHGFGGCHLAVEPVGHRAPDPGVRPRGVVDHGWGPVAVAGRRRGGFLDRSSARGDRRGGRGGVGRRRDRRRHVPASGADPATALDRLRCGRRRALARADHRGGRSSRGQRAQARRFLVRFPR